MRETQKTPKLRRFGRVCVSSLVVLVVVLTVANLTVAKLPVMPEADGKYISLRGKEIHYFEQLGRGVPVVMIHGLPGTQRPVRAMHSNPSPSTPATSNGCCR
jgi:hypothetical protein